MKKVKVKNIFLLCLPLIASGIMLTVIQAPISLSPLAWVSLVPFIIACSPAAKTKPLALAAYLVSLCYWLANLYWIAPITLLGWATFCLYTALFWPILALCLRYCRTKKIPLFLAAGILFVGAERLQGLFLGGFFWRHLAHSQYANITLIQIADIFGAAGVSFLVAMVNGLLAELIIAARPVRNLHFLCRIFSRCGISNGACQKHLFKISNFIKTAVVCAALLTAITYGRWRINQSEEFVTEGPLVASLQSNVPQSVKKQGLRGEGEDAEKTSKELFDELMDKSKAGAQAGAELIVWPETMVQAILDKEVWPFLRSSETNRTFDEALREHSKNTAFVLVGAYGGRIQQDRDLNISLARYNSAFLYRPDGKQDQERYDKIHLVLFGEVLPFRKSCPLLFELLMKFNPYGYDHSLDAGSQYTVFEMTGPLRNRTQSPDRKGGVTSRTKEKISNGLYRFSVMICYEATIPAIARRFALDRQRRKQVDWLINISNDGWFVRFKGRNVSPSTELSQHMAICVFRAVENRLSILRSVNTGISCIIDSLGQIQNGYIAASPDFPLAAIERKGIAGWFADKLPIDKRTTFFSKYGQWLDFCCAFCLILLIIVVALERIIRNKKYVICLRRRQNEK